MEKFLIIAKMALAQNSIDKHWVITCVLGVHIEIALYPNGNFPTATCITYKTWLHDDNNIQDAHDFIYNHLNK